MWLVWLVALRHFHQEDLLLLLSLMELGLHCLRYCSDTVTISSTVASLILGQWLEVLHQQLLAFFCPKPDSVPAEEKEFLPELAVEDSETGGTSSGSVGGEEKSLRGPRVRWLERSPKSNSWVCASLFFVDPQWEYPTFLDKILTRPFYPSITIRSGGASAITASVQVNDSRGIVISVRQQLLILYLR